MNEQTNRVAVTANTLFYNADQTKNYADGAPHIKHDVLRRLYISLVLEVYEAVRAHVEVPRVLDLGAGEGAVTLPLLELGAQVVAVDLSSSQLEALQNSSQQFADRLTIKCIDIDEFLETETEQYHIIVANSFLHHVPDYLGMIDKAAKLVAPQGHFFSFQDPLRYDTLGKATSLFSNVAYLSWRLARGDWIGGISRRFRRRRGIYLEESVHDNAEYHVVRNGVDQEAIAELLQKQDFDCRILPYFSTQSAFFQRIGSTLRLKNTFAVIARRRSKPGSSARPVASSEEMEERPS